MVADTHKPLDQDSSKVQAGSLFSCNLANIAVNMLDFPKVLSAAFLEHVDFSFAALRTSNANALVVNVPTSAHGGCCDEGGAHSRGQAHVANVHVDRDAPLALHAVVPQLLRSIIYQA